MCWYCSDISKQYRSLKSIWNRNETPHVLFVFSLHGVKTDLFSEADDQSLLQAFDAGVAQWKDHDDVKYLPCDAVRDRLMSARMGGTHLTEEVKKLRCPLQLQPWVSKLDELNATIRQVVHEAKGYLAQFQQLADNEKEKA